MSKQNLIGGEEFSDEVKFTVHISEGRASRADGRVSAKTLLWDHAWCIWKSHCDCSKWHIGNNHRNEVREVKGETDQRGHHR